jgi:hypothetical protein
MEVIRRVRMAQAVQKNEICGCTQRDIMASQRGELLGWNREAIKKLLIVQSPSNRSATCTGKRSYTTIDPDFDVDSLP